MVIVARCRVVATTLAGHIELLSISTVVTPLQDFYPILGAHPRYIDGKPAPFVDRCFGIVRLNATPEPCVIIQDGAGFTPCSAFYSLRISCMAR